MPTKSLFGKLSTHLTKRVLHGTKSRWMAIALALSIALNLGMWLRHRSGVSPQTPKAATASPSASPILDYWPALSAGYELAKDANALRERGDIKSALVRLQNTAAKDPQNARVHAEMAAIYESIQLFDSALEEWRKVQEIGPLAGELLYELANAKLKIGIAVSTPATPGSTTTRTTVDSPYENSTDFAKYAENLREQALAKVEPQVFVPTTSKPATRRFAWKAGIVTTVFWIGEKSNYKSSWDANWTSNYGGFDTPDSSARRNYIPVAFIPHQNPFYCALPYNDVAHGQFKPEGAVGYSVVQTRISKRRIPAGSLRMQGSLDRDSQRQSHLLRAMGGLRPISNRSLSICFRKRKTETESQSRGRSGRFSRGSRLSRPGAD